MSKLLTGLMEAERKRRQPAVNDTLPAAFRADPAGPAARNEVDLAADEALARRIEEEAAALATAQRNERRAAQLAAAAAARAANETNLIRLAQERAAAERRAADRAAAQLQAEMAAQAAVVARATAEKEAMQQSLHRLELEAEVSRLAAARSPAEPARPLVVEAVAPERGRQEPLPRGRLLAAMALAMAVGAAAGTWLGRPAKVVPLVGADEPPVSRPARTSSPAADPDAPYLRLDHELRAGRNATRRGLGGDS